MKQFNSLFLIVLSLVAFGSLQAQQRYLDEVFTDVNVQSGLIYGENFTLEFLPEVGTTVNQDLLFDFYEPAGDTATERPLVVLLHTGNFLPQVTNGSIFGTRTDSATVEIAERLAKRGYVVASIDYRLGWNPLAETQPARALGLIQAAYRGLQDTRTAIRYFRRDAAENNNSFGVDTSRITVWGMGTGGYISLATMTLDEYIKIATTTDPPGKFLYDPGTGTLIPMVIREVNGDINGVGYPDPTSAGRLPFPSPPLNAGDTLNIPNHIGFSSDYHLTVNMGGALGDISWLEAGQTPVISFQVPTDPFAPYESDLLIVPTTGEVVVQVQGAKIVMEKATSLGNNAPFEMVEDMFGEDPYTAAAKANSAAAGHAYYEGLFPMPRPTNIYGEEEGSPWNWWNPNASAAPGILPPWNLLPRDPDDPNSITFHEYELQYNADMSPENARTYIDTIMGYFAPRAFVALNLGGTSSVEPVLADSEVQLSLAPNPASDQVFINTDIEYPIQAVQLFDLNGRLLQSNTRINQNAFTLQRGDLPPGMYIAKLKFEKGIVSKKILFR